MSEQSEEWRAVVGWVGLYEVSSVGRVRSLTREVDQRNAFGTLSRHTYPGRILAQKTTKFGYRSVGLCRDSRVCSRLVHRLVCEAFAGEGGDGQEVAHGDGNRANNSALNLRWASKLENAADRISHGRGNQGSAHHGAKLSEEAVALIRSTIGMPRDGERTRRIARQLGITIEHFYGVRKSHGGRWKHI